MDPAKQNQIMGYFIEEALEHLTTIENGLLNLESMVTDPEMVNEVFRAAHSIKGGAAMLGISSVQHISHRLEDYFKVIKDNNGLNVDQQLQTLFLQSFDKLKDLLEHLSGPFGLGKEDADAIMSDVEPLFAQLKDHLNNLVDGKATVEVTTPPARQVIEPITVGRTSGEERAMTLVFQEDIPAKLRDMLQVFKEPDRPTSRQNLQLICDRLYQAGDQFDLKPWCDMLEVVKSAVGNPNNSFRVLAPVVIREVKQAQELVLAHRTEEIVVSSQLQSLLPPPDLVTALQQEDDISSVFGAIVEEDKSVEQWREFGDRVAWRIDNAWIRTAGINFDRSAPVGHLPAPIWLSAWDKSKDSNADEFREQLRAFMQKLGDC
ncbi:Hpt domain-containing protein [Pseudanabaena sp. PCC 6802]|uniref:Hpt domain-containing protein n=1 Tax=Pseudanabaena sp. PCC 6802 TaxID=118173 RepID=UPI000344EE9B|nr:Hpt domain-containing protein [Pseudanabaena sp. PCC 6802]